MASDRPLNIPVILGTARRGRSTGNVARFMVEQVAGRDNVTTELIDIADVPMPVHDAGEAIKDPGFAAKMTAADALVIVTPEYNHSFPGLLKHVLDIGFRIEQGNDPIFSPCQSDVFPWFQVNRLLVTAARSRIGHVNRNRALFEQGIRERGYDPRI